MPTDAAQAATTHHSTLNRLPVGPVEQIDRSQTISFTFEGKTYEAHPGDTIASALAAAGVTYLSRSFKYHRPRGLLCCAGHCPNCLVQIGDEPNVRACTRPVEPGMEVSPQNVAPSLEYDVMSLTQLGDRFTPVGFYYKTFIRPKALWPTYEKMLRQAAGLGKVNPDTPHDYHDKQYLHCDVAVVGGGPAGISAALTAAEAGARVALFDENPTFGGHLRFRNAPMDKLITDSLTTLQGLPEVTLYPHTTVTSWHEDNWMSAVRGHRLFKIRAGAAVFATGAIEQPLVFDNNDLPGVMLGSAVRRLLNLHRVLPGQEAVIVTANDSGWTVAGDLLAAGATIVAVVDERSTSGSPLAGQFEEVGIPIYWRHTIRAARGSNAVRGATIVPLDPRNQIQPDQTIDLSCDLLSISTGWAPANGLVYQAGSRFTYDHHRGEFLPTVMPASIYVAGQVAGTYNLATQVMEGRLVGQQAAAYLGIGSPPEQKELHILQTSKTAEPRRSSKLARIAGQKKRFLCFCEDVTDKDLEQSIAEGYNSIELLKRYSTISMGPCQGRMCSLNTIRLCARTNGWSIGRTGTTTSRPPQVPVSMGVLAGQNMEPVQVTAIDSWHRAHGAKMMVAGLWMRPEHYGDPVAEVKAVRERVGLIDVSTLGKLKMTGAGVPNLLDKLYINKWQKLGVGRVRYGVMCNDEGIILDDGVTAHVAELEWLTTTTSSGASAIYEWIQWWLQSGWGDNVHVTNVTEGRMAFNLAGPQSRAVLQSLTEADLSNEAFPYMHTRQIEISGVPCQVMRIGFTGELSYEIHAPTGYGLYLWEALLAAGQAYDILPFGVEAQRILRLEKAHLIVGQDTDALTDPIAADMAWAVKLDKADFLGQRPLMRISDEGPAQRLTGFKMTDSNIVPDEGLQIVRLDANNRPEIIGWVTSSRFSPTLRQAIGMCWLPPEIAEESGARFTIWMDGRLASAQVHHGPFFDPDGTHLRT